MIGFIFPSLIKLNNATSYSSVYINLNLQIIISILSISNTKPGLEFIQFIVFENSFFTSCSINVIPHFVRCSFLLKNDLLLFYKFAYYTFRVFRVTFENKIIFFFKKKKWFYFQMWLGIREMYNMQICKIITSHSLKGSCI